jgi:hypothetical protein
MTTDGCSRRNGAGTNHLNFDQETERNSLHGVLHNIFGAVLLCAALH